MSNSSFNDNNRWLLPEGVDEFLPPQAERLERLRRDLLDLFHTWGYELVIPPLIEYLESLLVGMGHDLDLETFKLIDQMTGRLMGVRADMTPQVSRIEAHRLNREAPVRLCYLDAVLRTRQSGSTRSRSPLQVGAELFGHAGIESDVEILRLMVETLRVTGLDDIHIDLGHVGIFRGLAQDAGLDQTQESTLFSALQRKATPEIESFLSGLSIDEKYRQMLVSLVDLNGGNEVLQDARQCLKKAGKNVQHALDNLGQVAQAVQQQLPDIPLYFDLAELRGYRYQTGIVYAAFIPGHGQELARGGRYDEIGRVFGRARPATGFSSDLKTLMALSPAQPYEPHAIIAPCSSDPLLQEFIVALRKQGERVICLLHGQKGILPEMGCDRVIEKQADKWVVVGYDQSSYKAKDDARAT